MNGVNLLGRRLAWVLSLASLLWSTALITNFDFKLFEAEKFGTLFNDMAERLLHLDMTIAPEQIGLEAFLRDGHTYTYFGIFPAFIRIPAILLGWNTLQLSRLSCLLALWIIAFATIRLTQGLLSAHAVTKSARLIIMAGLASVAFSGPVIYVLASAVVYHELIFWAAAWTAVFNCIVVLRICTGQVLTQKDFLLLALAAGCCVLTRITCGLALYVALGLLMAWPAIRSWFAPAALLDAARRSSLALLLAVAFVGIQAGVDYGRWGDPLIAYPPQYYSQILSSPRRAERLENFRQHGLLDPIRVSIAVVYYGLGIKVDHEFPSVVTAHYDMLEGPRTIVPLCAPWIIVCGALGLYAVLSESRRWWPIMPLVIGNGVGFVLPLAVWDLALRYTFDGWGFVTLVAGLGTRWLADRAGTQAPVSEARRFWIARTAIAVTLLGIAMSHAVLLRYKINFSGTKPEVRYWLSQQIQPLLCPGGRLTPDVKLDDFIPLVTLNCPPLW
jgi:hypothetical protein